MKISELFENDAEHQDTLNKTGFWGKQGAGCLFYCSSTRRYLISHRSRHVLEPGTWGTWGGAIDSSEQPLEACKREVTEETGYHGAAEYNHLWTFKSGSFQYHNFLVTVPEEFEPTLDWENQGFAWVEYGKWPDPLHPGLKSLIASGTITNNLVETTNASKITAVENIIIDSFRSVYDHMISGKYVATDHPPKGKMPTSLEDFDYSKLSSLPNIINNSFSDYWSNMSKKLSELFNLSGTGGLRIMVVNISDRTGAYTRDITTDKIMISGATIENFQNEMKLYLLKTAKNYTIKTNMEKWGQYMINQFSVFLSQLKETTAFKDFARIMLHELTHGSQESKLSSFDHSEASNVFGNKFNNYYNKIAAGIMDKDYYGGFNEIDSYANEVAAKIIQQTSGKINIQSVVSDIKHPAYDIFLQISKENEKDSKKFLLAWKRFIKRVVLNLNEYNDSISDSVVKEAKMGSKQLAKYNVDKISKGELTPELMKYITDNDVYSVAEISLSRTERSAIEKTIYQFSQYNNVTCFISPQGVIVLDAKSLNVMPMLEMERVISDIVAYADDHKLPVAIRGYFMDIQNPSKVSVLTTNKVRGHGFKIYQGNTKALGDAGLITLIKPNGGITEFTPLLS